MCVGDVQITHVTGTGLNDNSTDVVVVVEMLTMQDDMNKHVVVAEVSRALRPLGRSTTH